MKKRVLFTFALMFSMLGAFAQNPWSYDPNQYDGETYVYCDIRLGTEQSYTTVNSSNASNYKVAAFIDDEVRATATAEAMPGAAPSAVSVGYYFCLRVKGTDDDMGKTITFKIWNLNQNTIYDATLVESPLPVTYDGEVKDPGQPGNLRHLYLNEPTQLSLQSPITVSKGESVDLKDYLTVTPAGAALPENLVFEDTDGKSLYFDIVGSTLTGSDVGTGHVGVRTNIINSADVGPSYLATAVVNVVIPATSLTIKEEYQTITVNRNDWETLTNALANAYTLDPEDATDQVTWTIADPNIVQYLDSNDAYKPVAEGTTTMTAQILDEEGNVRLSATLTVKVVVPVEDFTLSRTSFNCNIGDDLTDFVKSLVSFTPEDATNQNLVFSKSTGTMGSRLSITGTAPNQVIKAVKTGTTRLYVRPEEWDDSQKKTIAINIYNPVKSITATEDPMYVGNFTDTSINITDLIKSNFAYTPSGGQFSHPATDWITSSDPSVVLINIDQSSDDYTAFAEGIGEATITLKGVWTDYLKEYEGLPESEYQTTFDCSFKVIVTAGLTGFEVSVTDLVMGEEGTVTLTPQPSDAEYDGTKVGYYFDLSQTGAGSWGSNPEIATPDVTVGDGTATFTITPPIPGNYNIHVFYDGNEISEPYAVSVGARVDLKSGWQWTTLNYGNLSASEMQTYLGNHVTEVRSQTTEMYNDPTLGYFGPIALSGMSQDECYKVKMASAASFALYNGNYVVDPIGLSLNTGWTWIPNTYLFKRNLNRIAGIGVDGDRIVSKESGFAEFDGASGEWVGTLTQLEPGQGYLYYSDQGRDFDFPIEMNMPMADDVTGGGNGAPRYMYERPWQYDASLWRDNMSIIAKAVNADDLYEYSVGAFVGEECRGEGKLIDGLLFITVNGKSGETVTFRIYDPVSGQYFETEETMKFRNAAGSLKAPVTLTKMGSTTGINDLEGVKALSGDAFDVNGVRQNTLKRGVNIIRHSDGQVRKVIVK